MRKKLLKISLFLFIIIRIIYTIYYYEFSNNYWNNKTREVVVESVDKLDKDSITYSIKIGKNRYLMYTEDMENVYNHGDKIKVICSSSKQELYNNPFEFNYKRHLNSKGILNTIYCNKIIKYIGKEKSIIDFAYYIRDRLEENIDKYLSDNNKELFKSIVYGDDNYLDKNLKNKFSNIGIGHFLCISGTHVIFLLSTFETITKSKNNILKIILLLYFYIISLFSISLLRSIIMYILTINTKYSFKEKYLIALYIIICINPYYIFNLGVIFSFLSILSIYIYSSIINSFIQTKIFRKINMKSRVIDNISTTISAQILIIPFEIYTFGRFSLIFIISNIIFEYLLIAIMSLGFSFYILAFIPGINLVISNASNILVSILIYLVNILNKYNYLTISFPKPTISIFILYYFLLIVLMYKEKIIYKYWKRRKILKHTFNTIIFVIILYIIIWYIYVMYFESYIIFFNVGQGNMALVHNKTKNIVIDCGSTKSKLAYNTLNNYMVGKNIKKIDSIYITHMHTDHMNAIEDLVLNNVYIGMVCFKEGKEIENILKENNIAINYLNNLDSYIIGDIKIEVIVNDGIEDEDILNANSTIYKVTSKNKCILFLGDSTKNTEKYLNNLNFQDINIVQIGHHGSKTSSSENFIQKFKPKTVGIISAKKSVYGHPSEETLKTLEKHNIKTYITEKKGAIIF